MPANRRTAIQNHLQQTTFDVLIVGGGISGAWIAQLVSEAGYSCALLDRGDFAGETSSSSSKLLHGGIRYLQQMQFGKVRESTMERARYLSYAPHLATAVPFVVPTFPDLKRSKLLLNAGMFAYQALGIGQGAALARTGVKLPATRNISAEQLNQLCDLSGYQHTGAVVFPEFHLYDSERTVWSIADSARQLGAVLANYTKVEKLLLEERRVVGVKATLEGMDDSIDISAKLVINAAGPWVDQVNELLGHDVKSADASLPSTINGYAAGAHLITRQLVKDHAIAITTQQKSTTRIDRGGRHIFIIPWRGYSLIGTSYRETHDPDSVDLLTQDDMDQLLDAVNEALPHARLQEQDIISAYSGLYPLRVEKIKTSQYQGTGEYLISDHATNDNLQGLVTALGAKFTTGRKLAELTVEVVDRKLANDKTQANSARALTTRLHSARYGKLQDFQQSMQERHGQRFSSAQIEHWIRCYGSNVDAFIQFMDEAADSAHLLEPIVDSQPEVYGQIAWAMEHEMAEHLEDALLRRSSIGLLGMSRESVGIAAQLMAERLGWDSAQIQAETDTILRRQDAIDIAARNYHAR